MSYLDDKAESNIKKMKLVSDAIFKREMIKPYLVAYRNLEESIRDIYESVIDKENYSECLKKHTEFASKIMIEGGINQDMKLALCFVSGTFDNSNQL